MRYFFRSDESKESFSVFLYPEPWSFELTPEEEKLSRSFPLTDEGMDSAIAWMREIYEAQKDRWSSAQKNCMHIVNTKADTV